MKTGDLMVELRKLPPGKPFHVKVGGETLDDGKLEVDDTGVKLVFEKTPKKPARKK